MSRLPPRCSSVRRLTVHGTASSQSPLPSDDSPIGHRMTTRHAPIGPCDRIGHSETPPPASASWSRAGGWCASSGASERLDPIEKTRRCSRRGCARGESSGRVQAPQPHQRNLSDVEGSFRPPLSAGSAASPADGGDRRTAAGPCSVFPCFAPSRLTHLDVRSSDPAGPGAGCRRCRRRSDARRPDLS